MCLRRYYLLDLALAFISWYLSESETRQPLGPRPRRIPSGRSSAKRAGYVKQRRTPTRQHVRHYFSRWPRIFRPYYKSVLQLGDGSVLIVNQLANLSDDPSPHVL